MATHQAQIENYAGEKRSSSSITIKYLSGIVPNGESFEETFLTITGPISSAAEEFRKKDFYACKFYIYYGKDSKELTKENAQSGEGKQILDQLNAKLLSSTQILFIGDSLYFQRVDKTTENRWDRKYFHEFVKRENVTHWNGEPISWDVNVPDQNGQDGVTIARKSAHTKSQTSLFSWTNACLALATLSGLLIPVLNKYYDENYGSGGEAQDVLIAGAALLGAACLVTKFCQYNNIRLHNTGYWLALGVTLLGTVGVLGSCGWILGMAEWQWDGLGKRLMDSSPDRTFTSVYSLLGISSLGLGVSLCREARDIKASV